MPAGREKVEAQEAADRACQVVQAKGLWNATKKKIAKAASEKETELYRHP